MLLLADIGVPENSQSFGIGGHDAVLDAVVHHLDEVTGAVRPTMQITMLGGSSDLLSTRCARNVPGAGRERRKNGIEMLHHVLLTSDHHAVASFQSPDTSAGAYVHVMNFLRGKLLRATDVVYVIGIATVDENVASFQQLYEISDTLGYYRRRHHQPNGAGLLQFLY